MFWLVAPCPAYPQEYTVTLTVWPWNVLVGRSMPSLHTWIHSDTYSMTLECFGWLLHAQPTHMNTQWHLQCDPGMFWLAAPCPAYTHEYTVTLTVWPWNVLVGRSMPSLHTWIHSDTYSMTLECFGWPLHAQPTHMNTQWHLQCDPGMFWLAAPCPAYTREYTVTLTVWPWNVLVGRSMPSLHTWSQSNTYMPSLHTWLHSDTYSMTLECFGWSLHAQPTHVNTQWHLQYDPGIFWLAAPCPAYTHDHKVTLTCPAYTHEYTVTLTVWPWNVLVGRSMPSLHTWTHSDTYSMTLECFGWPLHAQPTHMNTQWHLQCDPGMFWLAAPCPAYTHEYTVTLTVWPWNVLVGRSLPSLHTWLHSDTYSMTLECFGWPLHAQPTHMNTQWHLQCDPGMFWLAAPCPAYTHEYTVTLTVWPWNVLVGRSMPSLHTWLHSDTYMPSLHTWLHSNTYIPSLHTWIHSDTYSMTLEFFGWPLHAQPTHMITQWHLQCDPGMFWLAAPCTAYTHMITVTQYDPGMFWLATTCPAYTHGHTVTLTCPAYTHEHTVTLTCPAYTHDYTVTLTVWPWNVLVGCSMHSLHTYDYSDTYSMTLECFGWPLHAQPTHMNTQWHLHAQPTHMNTQWHLQCDPGMFWLAAPCPAYTHEHTMTLTCPAYTHEYTVTLTVWPWNVLVGHSMPSLHTWIHSDTYSVTLECFGWPLHAQPTHVNTQWHLQYDPGMFWLAAPCPAYTHEYTVTLTVWPWNVLVGRSMPSLHTWLHRNTYMPSLHTWLHSDTYSMTLECFGWPLHAQPTHMNKQYHLHDQPTHMITQWHLQYDPGMFWLAAPCPAYTHEYTVTLTVWPWNILVGRSMPSLHTWLHSDTYSMTLECFGWPLHAQPTHMNTQWHLQYDPGMFWLAAPCPAYTHAYTVTLTVWPWNVLVGRSMPSLHTWIHIDTYSMTLECFGWLLHAQPTHMITQWHLQCDPGMFWLAAPCRAYTHDYTVTLTVWPWNVLVGRSMPSLHTWIHSDTYSMTLECFGWLLHAQPTHMNTQWHLQYDPGMFWLAAPCPAYTREYTVTLTVWPWNVLVGCSMPSLHTCLHSDTYSMTLECFGWPLHAQPTHMNALICRAGGECRIALPVHVQRRSCKYTHTFLVSTS